MRPIQFLAGCVAAFGLGLLLTSGEASGQQPKQSLRPSQKTQKQPPATAKKQPANTTNPAPPAGAVLVPPVPPVTLTGPTGAPNRVADGQAFPFLSGMGPPSVAGPQGYLMRYYSTAGGYPLLGGNPFGYAPY